LAILLEEACIVDKPVNAHIQRIKDLIQQLEEDLPILKDPMESLKTETDLRSLRLALMHYELALQIEREVIDARSSRKDVLR
jgi:hypothetical protein